MNIFSAFDGISAGQLALQRAGINVSKYFASEIDKWAIKVTMKNFPDTVQLGDIRYVTGEMVGNIDLLIGGSPCQDLSGLKNGEGLKGSKSSLFFEYLRVLEELKPKYFLLENVVPRKREWKEEIDNLIGIKGVLINSDLFVQQNRPRIYWTNIPIPNLPERPNWVGNYYQFRRTYYRENKNGVCPCLTANMGTGGHNVPLKSMDKKDRLSTNEVDALQGFPLDYTKGVSNSQRYKLLGNSFTIDVLAHIFKNIPKTLT